MFAALDLPASLGPRLPELAQACFEWICERQQMLGLPWRGQLQMMKNTACAWRQMLFYLALAPVDAGPAFVAWAQAHLAQQKPDFQARFQPALAGLGDAVAGRSEGGRRFLGWATDRHWLLTEPKADTDTSVAQA